MYSLNNYDILDLKCFWNNFKETFCFKGGGVAGLFVDMVLFPLDTLKTRLQAQQGFRQAGGFKSIYKGIGIQAIGSAPQGIIFLMCCRFFVNL